MHIVFIYDSTQGTSTNRLKLFVNGVQITDITGNMYPSQNLDGDVNSTTAHYIGKTVAGYYYNGYLSDIYFID
jgi:hypothetical protein